MKVFDLHVHTARGSSDSALSPTELVEQGLSIGLHGACLTEHNSIWDRFAWQDFASRSPFVLIRAMEVETDLGHIVVVGLDSYVSGIHRARDLRRVADQVGAFLIAVHPFRGFFERHSMKGNKKASIPSIDQAAELPLFQLVDEIEVANGASTDFENFFALQVARRLEMRGTGGSDAHSRHGLGCCTTVFEKEIASQSDLIRELRAGRFYPAQGFPNDDIFRYGAW